MPKIDFTMGADPEFVGILDDHSNPASASTECDRVRRRESSSDGGMCGVYSTSALGADGSGRPFEVRPNPSNDPIEVVANIATILQNGVRLNPRFGNMTWKAGAYPCGWATGGHIHFGTYIDRHHVIDPREGTRILDNYVGVVNALVEGPEGRSRRNTGYGAPGGFRTQGHGFEYRTPASWLTSPYVAAGFLCLGKTVISEAINNPKAKLGNYSGPSSDCAGEYISCSNLARLRENFSSLWEDVTRMGLYQEYKQYLDLLYYLVNKKLTWEPKIGMKAAWGADVPSMSLPHNMTLGAIWSRYNQEVCHD